MEIEEIEYEKKNWIAVFECSAIRFEFEKH